MASNLEPGHPPFKVCDLTAPNDTALVLDLHKVESLVCFELLPAIMLLSTFFLSVGSTSPMDLRHLSWHCNEEQNTIGPSPSCLVVQMRYPQLAVVGQHMVLHVVQANV